MGGGDQQAGGVAVRLAGDVAAVPEHGADEQRAHQRLAQLGHQTEQRRLQQAVPCTGTGRQVANSLE